MASIEPRTGKDGRTTYRVVWVTGGSRGGKRDSETCDTESVARKFKALIEANGHQRPEDYPKGCRGIRHVEERLAVMAPPELAEIRESLTRLTNMVTEIRDLLTQAIAHPEKDASK